MWRMQSLRAFLTDRLTAAAEEIFGAVEKTIAEYKKEISRSKDLEISRLRMQLKLLKSDHGSDNSLEAQLLHHHLPPPPPPQHQSAPAVDAAESQHCEEDGGSSSSMEQEHPEASQVKKEQHKTHRNLWMDHNAEQLEALESDIKEFISSPSSLKAGLQEPTLSFHPYHDSSSEECREKPYSCSVCEKRFSNCSHLAAHIRTHTGERPYRCEICRKTFVTTSALNRHQTIHTEGKHFVCNYCGKSFKWMESLGRHMRSMHKRDDMPV
ncbi:zinc finger protein 583-like [Parambassis ranga]|uniref:Zinc finger protein 583-like n=1 Tax=Parambassis ranga TaxID=210632 RepID=A0A6P7JTL9_9TELE|nr:zinc finger protein 583-like [Parambassis ranga]